jgi:hypothetical protein
MSNTESYPSERHQEAKMETGKRSLRVWGTSALFCIVFGLATAALWAQTTVNANWIDTTGNWTNASNWSCNCVPNNSSANVFNVIVPTGNVTLENSTPSITINTLSAGATVELNSYAGLNVIGNVGVSSGGALGADLYGTTAPSTALAVGGNLTNAGSVGIGNQNSAITVTVAGNFVNTGSASTLTLEPTSSLDVASLTNAGTVDNFGGTISVSGDLTNATGGYIQSYGLEGPDAPAHISVGGNLNNDGYIVVNSGVFNPGSGGILLSVTGHFSNSGDLEIQNGQVSVAGNISNSGTIGFSDGSSLYGASLSNSGTLNISFSSPEYGGGYLAVNSFNNTGTVELGSAVEGGSKLTVFPGGSYTQTAGLTDVDGILMAPSVNISGGTLSGGGSISGDVINDAIVSPGDPATLTIDGNYTQKADGTLVIDIASATDFSMLDVTGQASLDGTVDFDFLNGYVPAPNTDFTFLEASSSIGAFTGFDFTNGSCPTCSFQVRTTPEPGSLILFGTALLGLAALLRKRQWLVVH